MYQITTQEDVWHAKKRKFSKSYELTKHMKANAGTTANRDVIEQVILDGISQAGMNRKDPKATARQIFRHYLKHGTIIEI
jgi:hypothetical protein